MRLTLRTLLAWLDGVLTAEEQVQLGEKVSASHTASALAEQIRLAVNQPAIAAPAPDARGLADDANSVADFLDNSLSAEQLAAFERICLDSVMHLAEVAACHSMLATLARQGAVSLTPAERQRLQTLVHDRLGKQQFGAAGGGAPHAEGDGHEESRETARALRAALGPGGIPAGGGPNAAAAADGSHVAVHPGHTGFSGDGGMPFERQVVGAAPARGGGRGRGRRSSPAARWSAVIAVSLLLVLVGVLGWSALRGGGRRAVPQAKADGQRPDAVEPAPPHDAVAAAADAPDEAVAAAPARADDGPAMPPASTDVAAASPPTGPAGPAKPNPTSTPAAPPTAVAATTPAGVAPRAEASTPASSAGPAALTAPSTRPAPPVPAAAAVPFVVVVGPLLRLVKQAGSEEWQHAAAGTTVLPGDELVVPPWSEAKLKVGGVEVSLLALTDAEILLDGDGMPRIDMLFGRCLVGGGEASRIGVKAGGLAGTIAAGPATRVAIEVGLDRADAGEDMAPVAAGASFITAGQRPFTWLPTTANGAVPAGANPFEVPAGNAVVLRDGRAALAAAAPSSWIDADGFSDRVQKGAVDALVAEISAGRPLLPSLRGMTADRRVENRMLAAATLALIGHSDELLELLEAAPGNRSYLEDLQWRTLERMAVPATLARDGEAKAALHRAIVKYAPPDSAELLWAMVRGFSEAEITGGGDRRLVESLDDPSLMVRRYAHKTLCDIARPGAADRARYRADALPESRRDGVAWWRSQLQQGRIHR